MGRRPASRASLTRDPRKPFSRGRTQNGHFSLEDCQTALNTSCRTASLSAAKNRLPCRISPNTIRFQPPKGGPFSNCRNGPFSGCRKQERPTRLRQQGADNTVSKVVLVEGIVCLNCHGRRSVDVDIHLNKSLSIRNMEIGSLKRQTHRPRTIRLVRRRSQGNEPMIR